MKKQVMMLIVAGLMQRALLPIAFGEDDDGVIGD